MNKRLKKVSGFMGPPEPVSQMNNLFATGALDPSWQMNLLSPGQDSMIGPEKLMAETAINNYPHDPVRRLLNRIREKKVKNNMNKHASIISYLKCGTFEKRGGYLWVSGKGPVYESAEIPEIKEDRKGGFNGYFMHHPYHIFLMNHAQEGLANPVAPGMIDNKQLKKVYERMKNFTPEDFKAIRERYPLNDWLKDKVSQRVIDQFGQHVAAGHHLQALPWMD